MGDTGLEAVKVDEVGSDVLLGLGASEKISKYSRQH